MGRALGVGLHLRCRGRCGECGLGLREELGEILQYLVWVLQDIIWCACLWPPPCPMETSGIVQFQEQLLQPHSLLYPPRSLRLPRGSLQHAACALVFFAVALPAGCSPLR